MGSEYSEDMHRLYWMVDVDGVLWIKLEKVEEKQVLVLEAPFCLNPHAVVYRSSEDMLYRLRRIQYTLQLTGLPV